MTQNADNKLVFAQEQIAATIAHEIKNPLALIRATLQYVELGDTKKTYKKKYDLIYREIDRLSELVMDYIELASPRAPVVEKFELCDILEELEQIFSETVKTRKIKLSITIHDRKLSIRADYNKIKQVMINLISNAIDSLEDRTDGEITVYACKKGHNAVIKVTDNGCGIKPQNLSVVGTPFFTTKANGTGLGLSISKEIIKTHNGTLSIKGDDGVGTVAIVTLKL